MNDNKKDPEDTENFEIESITSGGEENSSATAQVSELKKEIEKLKNDYLYLRADFDNYRKAKIKETAELTRYGAKRIIVELLSIIDTFELALSHEVTAENFQSFKEGMQLTASELNKLLASFGVKEIEILNKPFDPNTQEAISSEPTDQMPAGHVLRVFKKGYKLHDLLVRPAQVVVAQSPDKNKPES